MIRLSEGRPSQARIAGTPINPAHRGGVGRLIPGVPAFTSGVVGVVGVRSAGVTAPPAARSEVVGVRSASGATVPPAARSEVVEVRSAGATAPPAARSGVVGVTIVPGATVPPAGISGVVGVTLVPGATVPPGVPEVGVSVPKVPAVPVATGSSLPPFNNPQINHPNKGIPSNNSNHHGNFPVFVPAAAASSSPEGDVGTCAVSEVLGEPEAAPPSVVVPGGFATPEVGLPASEPGAVAIAALTANASSSFASATISCPGSEVANPRNADVPGSEALSCR